MASTQLAQAAGQQVARPLSVLVPLIQHDIENGRSAGDKFFREAGEKLLEAKNGGQISPNAFWGWVSRNFKGTDGKPASKGQAKRWMDFAEAVPADPKKPYTSIDDFRRRHLGEARLPGSKRTRLPPDVKAILKDKVDVEVLRKAALSQVQEKDAQRKLNLQMIDIGYKILAGKLHPDHGGSQEAMVRLNRGRDHLKLHA